MLREAAVAYTDPAHPRGCLVISAATNGSGAVVVELRRLRDAGRRAIEDKIGAEGDARGLAAFFATTIQGMSAMARDGATREDLELVVDRAMSAW